ncbi:ABC transporter substrate-binding protein [Jiangella muralis]|uniref:ABC transporter substrate-binding protein n=1 Tax=Jiangella muralis TaxID=702383 RepID=UPI00069EA49D|nr:ABC transporter substrate-binding protein [Jiangella muralis]
MAHDTHLSRRNFLWITAGAAALSACSGSNDTGASADGASDDPAAARILRYHDRTSAPDSLDPARGGGNVTLLTYDMLIRKAPDGSYEPQLATSWGYVGSGNTTFEIALRPDVSFTDGEPVTAEAVKANIEYRRDPAVGSQSAPHLALISQIEMVDELTVRLHLSEPNPLMPELFSQSPGGPGLLINPAVLADPSVLATETYGVGRYMLDPAETVLGDHYALVPDPTYWNADDIVWDKVLIHYMPEESAALAALQSGQLDAARVTFASVEAGKAAGLAATGPGYPIVLGLNLIDRAGQTSPALGDERVRQALNYAVDREKIVTALVGDSGRPTDQLSAPGQPGWHDEPFYPYDPDRATELLTDAGYADGFAFTVRIPQSEEHVRLTQAIADNLSEIGVEMKIDAIPPDQYQGDDATNRGYGALYLGWGVEPPYRMASNFWLPNATNNAFDTLDQDLVDLNQQSAAADEDARADLDQQIIARVAELAWFLPIVLHGESVLFNSDVVEVPWVDFASVPLVSEFRPAG